MANSQETLLLKIKEQGDLVRKLKAAKESNEKGKKTCDSFDLAQTDKHLSQYSYIGGYTPSKYDTILSKKFQSIDIKDYKHTKRWLDHMRSFSESEKSLFCEAGLPKNLTTLENSNIDEQVCSY